jgi:hypothetical protein
VGPPLIGGLHQQWRLTCPENNVRREKPAAKSKGNLGQNEADVETTNKERLDHMEADETDGAGQNAQPTTRRDQGTGQQRERR